ncbi:MAG: metallophosphoesterase, partial [bacterium]
MPPFDVVIITGDIAWRNGEDGWSKFEDVIAPLRDAGKFPNEDHVVITPGNHDVQWGVPVDDSTHYTNFVNVARAKPYVTPLLDGVDVDRDGAIIARDLNRHFLLDLELGLAIVPLNSSHYCGVYEPLKHFDDAELEAVLARLDADGDKLRKELESHRLFDMPRISGQQLRGVVTLLVRLRESVSQEGGDWRDIVQIAAMHHHTLPVGTSEEVKAFESLTNLGEVREFLAAQSFRVLTHGHKHAAGIYWDRIHLSKDPLNSPDWNLLVISGSTLGSAQQGQEEAARIVTVAPNRRQRSLAITRVPLVPVGGQLPNPLITERAELWRAEMGPAPVAQLISGDDADEVYQRVQALFAELDESSVICQLVCEIRTPDRSEQLPAGYPDDVPGDSPQERQRWFTDMVQWWQREETRLIDELHFTHGQRLRRYGDKHIDQLNEAIRVLQNDSASTRAVITLIDPLVDEIAIESRKVPSFSLVHLSIRVTRAGGRYLDCFGFFRKQEMRFWWPINVAELQRIQATVIDKLSSPDLKPGSILTYT